MVFVRHRKTKKGRSVRRSLLADLEATPLTYILRPTHNDLAHRNINDAYIWLVTLAWASGVVERSPSPSLLDVLGHHSHGENN